jgi:hypothetical protein
MRSILRIGAERVGVRLQGRQIDSDVAMTDDPSVEIQNILRAGVTKARLDPIARSGWMAAVYESMRVAGGVVVTAIEEPTVGRNFYRVTVRLPDGSPVALLLNAVVRLVAATDPGQGDSIAASFVDVPHGDVFGRAGFGVAEPSDLHQPVKEQHLRSLAEDERQDAAYHEPARLGDLLFNWFD